MKRTDENDRWLDKHSTAKRFTDFQSWPRKAKPGEEFIYHRAKVWLPCSTGSKHADVFKLARRMSDDGMIFLYQRKAGTGEIEYVARRISKKAAAFIERVAA